MRRKDYFEERRERRGQAPCAEVGVNIQKIRNNLLSSLVLGCVLLATTVHGQYQVEFWTTDNGLPQNTVRSILQTRDGYLWLTTLDGLVRYDGVRFTIFNKNNTTGIDSFAPPAGELHFPRRRCQLGWRLEHGRRKPPGQGAGAILPDVVVLSYVVHRGGRRGALVIPAARGAA